MKLITRARGFFQGCRECLLTFCSPRKGIKTADPHYKPRPKRTAAQIQFLQENVEPLQTAILCVHCRNVFPLEDLQDRPLDLAEKNEEKHDSQSDSREVLLPRILIIGDTHGCAKEFKALLQNANFVKGTDILILTGDIMVKGGESRETLRLAMETGAFFVRGNHDWEILRRHGRASPPSEIDTSDGATTHDRVAQGLSADEVDYLAKGPHLLYIPTHEAVIVHAALQYPLIAQTNAYDAMHGRNYVLDSAEIDVPAVTSVPDVPSPDAKKVLKYCPQCAVPFESETLRNILCTQASEPCQIITEDITVGDPWAEVYPVDHKGSRLPFAVFGHDARRKLQKGPNAYGIDTGCAYGGSLTALALPSRELFHVEKFD